MMKSYRYQIMSFVWSTTAMFFIAKLFITDRNSLASVVYTIGVFGSLALALMNDLLAKKE